MNDLVKTTNKELTNLFLEADRKCAFLPTTEDREFSVADFLMKMEPLDHYSIYASTSANGEVMGFISLLPGKDESIVAIGPMYISENSRGKGAGRFQVEEIIKIAKERNFKKIFTKTWGQNIGSRKIFDSLGFTLIKEKLNDRINGDSTVAYELDIK